MYEYLEGRPAARGAARLVLDVGGVGYDLAVPVGARFEEGATVRAWTHLVVREDAHALYGFPDRGTRDLFRVLLGVRGVGPALALGILSSLDAAQLTEALVRGDVRPLLSVKGVGKRTADQILLDLRDKAAALTGAAAEPGKGELTPFRPDPAQGNIEDAVNALVSIGFKEREARENVQRAAEEVDPSDLERLVRAALSS